MNGVAQGIVDFLNLNIPAGLNAPVYQADGVTPLSGAPFTVELSAGPSADSLAFIATTGFLQGAGAGYLNGGTLPINSVAPSSVAWIRVDAWNTTSGATFEQAKASGLPKSWWESSVFSVVTGNPLPSPTPGAVLSGLGTSPVYLNSIPEPCAFGLIGLGSTLALVLGLKSRTEQAPSTRPNADIK